MHVVCGLNFYMSQAPASQRLSIEIQVLIVLMCAAIYYYAYQFNAYLSGWFEFSQGVSWIYIPSGLRLLFVLVLTQAGSVGLILGSILINYSYGLSDAHTFNIVTAFISGGSPYLARQIAIDFLHLDTHLTGLNARAFLKISLLFALISAVLHQAWYFWIGRTQDFIAHTFVMAVGDWFGSVLVLASASMMLKIYKWAIHIRP